MIVYAVDPGYEQSAVVAWDGGWVRYHSILANQDVLDVIGNITASGQWLVLEQIESFGMAVGRTVFETVFWSGRFAQAASGRFDRVTRREVKLHLCGTSKAKDANIRQAILDRFGPDPKAAIGTKKAPGPLHGIHSHEWSALAVALTWWDTKQDEREGRVIRPGIVADF